MKDYTIARKYGIGEYEDLPRYELSVSPHVPQHWRLYDRKERTFTWSMTIKEMNEYLRSIGVRSDEV